MKRNVMTIGSYDGLHIGHQAILNKIIEISHHKKIESSIFFLETPPKLYFKNELVNSLITLPEERRSLIKNYGVEKIFSIEFNNKVHTMSPEDFFNKFVFSQCAVEDIVVGKDFAIGYQRRGNLEWLFNFARDKNFSVHIVDYIKYHNHIVSSTLVREFLKKGKVDEVKELLARPYSLYGIVKKGAGIGRRLGYPTANIEVDIRKILPLGIFAVEVNLRNERLRGVANVGKRPTFNTLGGQIICEVHIFDFNKDIYGELLGIKFLHKIREEKKFRSADELVCEIKNDIERAKGYFFEQMNQKKC
ncbi:MAG: riboflavin biosynthesis protein RibF [Elusimicrobiales bacterium]